MKLSKKPQGSFKKNFVLLFLLELSFLLSNFLFLVFVKNKVKSYLLVLQQKAPEIAQLQQSLQGSSTRMADAQVLISTLLSSTQRMVVFAFVLVPLVLVVLWSLFQGLIGLVIRGKEVQSRTRYLIHVFIWTLVWMGLFFVIAYRLVGSEAVPSIDINMLLTLLLAFVCYFALFMYYASVTGVSFVQDLKLFLKRISKSFLRKFLCILVCFVVSLAVFFFFIVLFASVTLKTYFLLPLGMLLLFLVGGGAVSVVLRFLYVRRVRDTSK